MTSHPGQGYLHARHCPDHPPLIYTIKKKAAQGFPRAALVKQAMWQAGCNHPAWFGLEDYAIHSKLSAAKVVELIEVTPLRLTRLLTSKAPAAKTPLVLASVLMREDAT